MNKRTHLKHSIIALLGIALLSISCSRDGSLDVLENKEVSFSVNSEAISTKVTPATTSTITAAPFMVMAYKHDRNPNQYNRLGKPYANPKVSYTGGAWIANPRVYWPATGSLQVSFVAYWPEIDDNGITYRPAISPSTVTFKVNGNVDNQVDFLLANSFDHDDNPGFNSLNVHLQFKHVLTGVRFKCYENVTIDEVTISGVKNKGNCSLDLNYGWSGQTIDGTDNSYTLTDITYDAASGGYKSFKLEHTLFMLPQILPSGAEIAVKVNGKADVIKANMGGHVWDSGKIITYLIKETLAGITLDIVEIKKFEDYPEDIVFGQPDVTITPINEENDYGGILN